MEIISRQVKGFDSFGDIKSSENIFNPRQVFSTNLAPVTFFKKPF